MRKTGCMKAARCFLSSKWKGKVNPMESSNQFLGTERIGKLMQKYAIPCIISLLVGALYNIVDQIFIANASYLGSYGNAANTVVFPLTVVALAIAVMIGDGCCAFVSISLGQNEVPKAKRSVGNAVVMCLVSSIVLAALYLIFADTILAMFGGTVNAETYHHSQEYFFYITLGVPFYMFGQAMNPIIRADGNPRFAMVSTLAGAALNIILDPILIFGFGLGVQGAAIATVLSQAVGAAWILQFLTGKKTILRLRKDYLRPEKQVILPVLALGISTFVMLSTESLLSISFSSSLARYGGDVAVGAMTVITSASQLCTLPIQGVCQGGQPVMSFNFGAGKKDRVKQAFRFQLTLCLGYTTIFWLLMMLVPGAVAGIFTSDASLIDYTTWAMRIYMAGIFAMGFQIACQQSFMALGQAKVSLLLACLRKIILLIPLIFILPHLVADPVFGVFLAEPVSDILAATITTITFFTRFDKILDQGAARV